MIVTLRYKLKFERPVYQSQLPTVTKFTDSDQNHVENTINDLVSVGAISKCNPCSDQYISRIFLVPKPNGKKRLILNLRNLNKFMKSEHFKLEDIRTVLKLISKDSFIATLDLKDAYE